MKQTLQKPEIEIIKETCPTPFFFIAPKGLACSSRALIMN